jgi:transposase
MEVLIPCCAGLDVHKKTVEAHVRRIESNGRLHQATRAWSTLTRELLAMSDWLAAQGVTYVAMESTVVYFALSSALFGRVKVPPALG